MIAGSARPLESTTREPPLDTVVLLAMPPDSTTCEPVKTVTPLARPKRSCSPPEICAPESIPVEAMISEPPSKIVVPIAVPLPPTSSPTPCTPPLLIVVSIATPLPPSAPTYCMPRPLIVVPLATPLPSDSPTY